jgi:hypothetical protein
VMSAKPVMDHLQITEPVSIPDWIRIVPFLASRDLPRTSTVPQELSVHSMQIQEDEEEQDISRNIYLRNDRQTSSFRAFQYRIHTYNTDF